MSKTTVKGIKADFKTNTFTTQVNISNDTAGYNPYVEKYNNAEELVKGIGGFGALVIQGEYNLVKSAPSKLSKYMVKAGLTILLSEYPSGKISYNDLVKFKEGFGSNKRYAQMTQLITQLINTNYVVSDSEYKHALRLLDL